MKQSSLFQAPPPSGEPTSHTLKTLKQRSNVFGPSFYDYVSGKICRDEILTTLEVIYETTKGKLC